MFERLNNQKVEEKKGITGNSTNLKEAQHRKYNPNKQHSVLSLLFTFPSISFSSCQRCPTLAVALRYLLSSRNIF